MPEPVTIVSMVVGLLSLLFNARNGLEKLMSDVNHVKAQYIQLRSWQAEIEYANTRIKSWKVLWRIDERFPPNLQVNIWGRQGGRILSDLLELLQSDAISINQAVTNNYRPKQGISHLITPKGQRSREHNSEGDISLMSKVKNALFRDAVLQTRLKRLDENISRLEKLSENYFRSRQGFNVPVANQSELDEWMNHFITEIILSDIAEECSQHSEALYLACLNEGTITSDLSLQHLVRETWSSSSNSDKFNSHLQEIVYNIAMKTRRSGQTHATILFNIHAQPHLDCCTTPQHTLLETHRAPNCECLLMNCRRSFRLGSQPTRLDDPVEECFFQTESSKEVQETVASLRGMLCKDGNDFREKLHGDFTRLERTTLAYLLARFTFIMLRTSWVLNLCSCTVVYNQESAFRNYSIRIGQGVKHLQPMSAEFRPHCNQWCQEEFKHMPIRQLGVLLTEIAIGETVYDARLNLITRAVEIDFDQMFDESQNPKPSFVFDIMKKVEFAASKDYARVVEWCLTQRLEGSHLDEAVRSNLYTNVLKPLRVRYQGEVALRERYQRRFEKMSYGDTLRSWRKVFRRKEREECLMTKEEIPECSAGGER